MSLLLVLNVDSPIYLLFSPGTLFEIETVTQHRGVNLGGWFIPEVWMLSSFFDGTGLGEPCSRRAEAAYISVIV